MQQFQLTEEHLLLLQQEELAREIDQRLQEYEGEVEESRLSRDEYNNRLDQTGYNTTPHYSPTPRASSIICKESISHSLLFSVGTSKQGTRSTCSWPRPAFNTRSPSPLTQEDLEGLNDLLNLPLIIEQPQPLPLPIVPLGRYYDDIHNCKTENAHPFVAACAIETAGEIENQWTAIRKLQGNYLGLVITNRKHEELPAQKRLARAL